MPTSSSSAASFDPGLEGHDPFEAIFALNMGEFLVEDFISNSLLDRIELNIATRPEKLDRQLEELVRLYAPANILSVLHWRAGEAQAMTPEQQREPGAYHHHAIEALSYLLGLNACRLYRLKATGLVDNAMAASRLLTQVGDTAAMEAAVGSTLEPVVQGQAATITARLETGAWTLATRLRYGGERLGVMTWLCDEVGANDSTWIRLAETTANLFAIAMSLESWTREAERLLGRHDQEARKRCLRAHITEAIADIGIYQELFVEALADWIDARCDFTQGHAQRVASVAEVMAEQSGWSEAETEAARLAGLCVGLGKIDMSAPTLADGGALADETRQRLARIPSVGAGLLGQLALLSDIAPWVAQARERYDGSGGPIGLKGQAICPGARLIALADAYVSLREPRPYRRSEDGAGLSHDKALEILNAEAGVKWDPGMVNRLMTLPAEMLAELPFAPAAD